MRGEISAARREVIAHAFAKLDKNNSGTVTLEDLRGVYSVEGHPGFTVRCARHRRAACLHPHPMRVAVALHLVLLRVLALTCCTPVLLCPLCRRARWTQTRRCVSS